MIAEETIKNIQDRAEIVEVIQHLLPELKKKGAGYEACCPFHDEKSPSFHVTPAKQMFKCFGCGKGGDTINFVKDYKRLSFTEAVKWLADFYKIDVKFERDFDKAAYEEKLSREQEIHTIYTYAEDYYHKTLLRMPDESEVWQYLYGREIDRAAAIAWRLGYAPDTSNNITTTLINKGLINTSCEIGILKQTKGVTYDFYRHRVMLPIKDARGNLIGFTGRRVGNDDQYAKYINPPESEIYNKSSQLFGIYEADKAIRKIGFAYQVEGNFDVVSMHLAAVENTIAPGGTALTPEQVKLLRRYTDTVVIMGDGDKAGIKAMMKNIDLYLQFGFRVEVCELPEGEDPDSFIRSLKHKKHAKTIAA